MLSSRTCSITCAYCHNLGHHIRDCVELANKNRRRSSPAITKPIAVAPLVKAQIVAPKNVFSALCCYSSSDEEEEGEIVEERRPRPSSLYEEDEEEVPVAWSRSGIQGVKIELVKSTADDESDYEFDDKHYNELLISLGEYVAQFRGMAWADI